MRADGRLGILLLALAVPAFVLTAQSVLAAVAWSGVPAALLWPDPLSLPDTIVHDSLVPRVLLAWAAGAGLSAAGVLLQRVLQNPLGSPSTFGLSGGASLAIALALLLAPGLLAVDRFPVALAGVAASMLVVALLAVGQGLSPMSLALSGLLLSLLCGAALSCLYLLRGQSLGALAIWGAGSLDGARWITVRQLWPRLVVGLLGALSLLAPLHTMGVDDVGARARGVPVAAVRLIAMVVTTWLVAAVSGAVGAVGFVDFAAVAAVRLVGARTVHRQLVWSLPIGAAILWLADGIAQLVGGLLQAAVPTGAITGLLGAPLLVVLARRIHEPPADPVPQRAGRDGNPPARLCALCLLLGAAIVLALAFGRDRHGWHFSSGGDFSLLLPWRGPRVIGAAAAGSLLAMAGVLTQRLTGNPLASPELLGVGTVASLATVVLLAFDPAAGRNTMFSVSIAACVGAFAALLAVSRRNSFYPTALLLTGLGLSAALGTGLNLVLAMTSLDSSRILSWIGGSTYLVDAAYAWIAAALALCGLAAAPFLRRWLDILPAGVATAAALGVNVPRARVTILLIAAVMVGSATLIVGPFAFIGLIAPQLARLAGFRRASSQCVSAALIGALTLVMADLIGRNILFPYQLPAGAMASVIGLVPVLVLNRRSERRPS